ncbi:MAG: hypothetical protein F4171_14070 [Gammaproteobacteria bacterium]|nr:hypothetical protein [Gammaproteobacteria bacterium]MYK28100.1 hypothetical protein [Gammaproteobacteria bacterium]
MEDPSLPAIKFIAAASILAIALIGGAIPMAAARYQSSQRFFSLGNAFAGGLFLGVGFIHLLPEGIEQLGEVVDYPLGALLAALGLGALLLIDRVLFDGRHVPPDSGTAQGQSIYPLVLLLLLSIHSIITGLSLGLESHASTAIILALGIVLHKGSEAFALMVSTISANFAANRRNALLGVFAAMTPVGILAGMLGSSVLHGDAAALVEGSFNALAAGTFIYIAILDIIDEEFSKRDARMAKYVMSTLTGDDDVPMPTQDHDRIFKFLLVIAGIVVMAMIGDFAHPHGAH